MNDPHRRAARIIQGCSLGAVIFLGAYAGLYLWAPLPAFWGNLLFNLFDVLGSGAAALMAILVWRCYRPTESPASVWRFLALGMCAWVVADTAWMVYNMTLVTVPNVSVADLFYLLGYGFIFTALHRQYRLLYRPSLRRDILFNAIMITGLFLIDYWITNFVVFSALGVGRPNLGDYLTFLYPVVDLAVAGISLMFIGSYGKGAFARPWIGLATFTVADGLYAWLDISGRYSYSVIQKNLLSLAADGVYLLAYLLLAILLLNYYLLLHYGPSVVGNFAGRVRGRPGASSG